MEINEVKKDLKWSQIIGIAAIVGLAILMGGSIAAGLEMYFETYLVGDITMVPPSGNSVMIPEWVNIPAIIFAIVVLIVIAIISLLKFRKR
jgi:hypothetical protein